MPSATLRIPFDDLVSALHRANLALGLPEPQATLSARLFAETTRDGVYTHGLNRFARFAAMIANGSVRPAATPSLTAQAGAIERWSGNGGPGNTNAHTSMQRAIDLAHQHGLGAVALADTNHWMRGGSYGWQAADQGLFAICWTNTSPNTPAWGTTGPTLGNNPLVLAIPRPRREAGFENEPAAVSNDPNPFAGGPHIVLDMALSQFSYGQIDAHIARGEQLPYPGGFDLEGNLTTDPAAIRRSYRALPIGLWKGSGLALTLDLFAAALSGGLATHQISVDPLYETGVSQFFLAIHPRNLIQTAELTRIADALIDAIQNAPRADPNRPARYPGEETLRLRGENTLLGVPVEEAAWQQLLSMSA